MTDKLEINLLEENEIGFKLKIEGSESEISSAKSKIRFTITESKTGKGWIFNTETKKSDGNVIVNIPSMKGMVSESENYSGKLEVILGNKYFTPTEVDIKFTEPLKVEAAIMQNPKTKKPITDEEELLVESVIIVKEDKPATKLYKDLLESDKEKINKIFLEKCRAVGLTHPHKHIKNGSEAVKTKMKNLIEQITVEYLKNQ